LKKLKQMTKTGPIVLVGLMATGKSTVGARAAAALGRPFFDSDEMVEARTGHTVAYLWAEGGEPAFRGLESDALQTALLSEPPGVVAAAGGVVLDAENRARLRAASARGGVVVWLRADPDLLVSRVRPGDHRPLLGGDPVGVLHRMAADRESLYAEVADRVVDINGETIEKVTDAVLDAAR
jgi:shikimate kinase